jgi:hypothetical protein
MYQDLSTGTQRLECPHIQGAFLPRSRVVCDPIFPLYTVHATCVVHKLSLKTTLCPSFGVTNSTTLVHFPLPLPSLSDFSRITCTEYPRSCCIRWSLNRTGPKDATKVPAGISHPALQKSTLLYLTSPLSSHKR